MASDDVRFLHVDVRASPERVYAFAADPRNLPRWAPNFARAVAPSGDAWIAETADGPARVRFAPRNDLGVLDHWVGMPDGGEVYVPLRVVASGTGSLIVFTLFRQEGFSNAQMDADAALVMADLERLKAQVEADESAPSNLFTGD
jgi:uncharacterized protein YndB with AHSA1/START domain